ncbi:MAG: membrane dipeptidase [Armatimonadetes bacterium]|nr:membrane dipeptidase [Armatimonadota bacterium]
MSTNAQTLHQSAVIIDAHNDSIVRRMERGLPTDLAVPVPEFHVDLPRLREGGVTAMFTYCGSTDLVKSLQLIDALHAMVAEHPDGFSLALTASDVVAAKESGRIGLIPQLESLTCCMGSLEVLRDLYRLGVRVGNLTHGEATEHGTQKKPSIFDYVDASDRETFRRPYYGLTDFGREAIREMNHLGMVVDLAHASDAAFYEALEISTTPPIFSHGSVFALCPHSRGLTDDQIRALAGAGGVHGVACYTRFIHREHPDMKSLVDLIEHSINLVGPDHVGIGADYDGLPDTEIPVPPDVGRLGEITAEMASRGWDDETILKVLGGNFMRILTHVLK